MLIEIPRLASADAHRDGAPDPDPQSRCRQNQLLGQPDRTFPGLTLVLPDVLSAKVGYLIAAEFADPARLAALGSTQCP